MHTRELFNLSGRVAIVTGGSVGLGRQMAQGLAEMGANVVLCARKKERCEAAAAGVAEAGREIDGAWLRRERSGQREGRG